MKARVKGSFVRAALVTRGALVVVLVLLGAGRAASAQQDPRQALDRYEPSERGSEWFANDSLDLRGRLRPSLGYVVTVAHRPLVVPNADGSGDAAPVSALAYLHIGGSLVLVDRLRVALDFPFQVYASGATTTTGGAAYAAPEQQGGVGDLRLAADVRLFGEHGHGVTGAVGAALWLPTGQRRQWSSDGVVRARPRVLVAGEHGPLVWAAQLGVFARTNAELTGSAAVGVKLAKQLVVGPELLASTTLDDPFAARTTPVEATFGAHWLIDGTARAGLGIGGGLSDGIGAPSWRVLFGVEWAPGLASTRKPLRKSGHDEPRAALPDEDHDGIPDVLDACPHVVGIATTDPRTNGCPPDTDGDGVDDLTDACPTVPGIATADPATTGCPDRDRDHDGIPNDLDACPDERGAADVEPKRNGCPKAFVRGSRIELLDPIAFAANGSAALATNAENEAILTAVLAVLLELPVGRTLRVEGHTDARSDRRLGGVRAAAVAKWLVAHGIDAARITIENVGADRPVATNETEGGRAENRRLELHLVP